MDSLDNLGLHRRERAGFAEVVLNFTRHGKGFASEALAAALIWGRDHFGPARVVCVIDNNNAASIRLAEKHGFRQFADAERTGKPRLVFARVL